MALETELNLSVLDFQKWIIFLIFEPFVHFSFVLSIPLSTYMVMFYLSNSITCKLSHLSFLKTLKISCGCFVQGIFATHRRKCLKKVP